MYSDKEPGQQTLSAMYIDDGRSVLELSMNRPVLLIFLRHFGCVFCKEALSDIAQLIPEMDSLDVQLVFVHMADNEVAESYFKKYNMDKVAHISDPACIHYKAFGIEKGKFSQLYGMNTWIRGFSARRDGHQLELSKALGNTTQMPGLFVVQDGEIKERYLHQYASDRPDYLKLLSCCVNMI